jgi:N-methylhydantoinase B/oxoprolinase/acetone carboxylase alpha subunit
MDKSVETIIAQNPKMRPGDVFVLNAPYNGGTHLPDITVVTPVFDKPGKSILFYVASRGHHADVGGKAPGSMTPRATSIEEEGVVIDNFKMIDRGRFREKELHDLLTSGPTRAATRPRISPTSRPRWRPTKRACTRSGKWWRSSASRWCRPIWAMSRTMPRKACAG